MGKQDNLEKIQRKLQELDILEIKEKNKLKRLQNELEILDVLENKENIRLKKLQQQEKKTTNKEKQKKIPQSKTRLASKIAKRGLLTALVLHSPSIGQSETRHQSKENEKKEIILVKEWKKAETNKIKAEEIDRNKNKTITMIQTAEETNAQIPNIKPTTTVSNTREDDVFTIIDIPDPEIDPNRYSNRQALSSSEREIVKDIYKQAMASKTQQEIYAVINQINSIKITRGLRDVLVKKTMLMKKKWKNVQHLQSIGQINVSREEALIVQSINATQIIVGWYTTSPSNFIIQPIAGFDNASNLDYKQATIKVNFSLKQNGNTLGIISFDATGKLLTTQINTDDMTYTISQNGKNIEIM